MSEALAGLLSPSSPSHPSSPSRRPGSGETAGREGSPQAPATQPDRGLRRRGRRRACREGGGREEGARWGRLAASRAPPALSGQPRPGPGLPPAASRWSVDSLPRNRALRSPGPLLSSGRGGSGDGSVAAGGRGSGSTCCPDAARHSPPEPSSGRPGTPGVRERAWRAPLPRVARARPGPGWPRSLPARPWAFVFLQTLGL